MKPGPKPNPNRKTRSHSIWQNMKARCSNPNNTHYKYYGGKGVKVCERWQSFDNFYADMGESPPKATIERIDSDGWYEPSNCRWATRAEQMRNISRNVNLTLNGITQCLSDWATQLGINRATLQGRMLRGWPNEKVLTTPVGTRCQRKD